MWNHEWHAIVRMTTISFWIGFRHAHSVQMTFHILLNGLSSCTLLYKWLPSLLNGLLSYTFLYEWLPFLFQWIVVMHVSVRMTTIFSQLIFVMLVSVRMTTISFWMDFRHARFCANDYRFVVYGFSSFTFCGNDFPFSCIWIFFMHSLCLGISIYFCLSMICAMLFNAWIAWCSDEL